MARRCALTGTGSQSGHKVSHSNHKTNVRFLPNLQQVSLRSDVLNSAISLRITAATLRSIEHNGGLDAFLLKNSDRKLTAEATKIKRAIKRKMAATSAAA